MQYIKNKIKKNNIKDLNNKKRIIRDLNNYRQR